MASSAKSFQCPNCAASQEIIAAEHSQTYACPSCFAIIDLTKPEFEIITKYQEVKNRPVIPLGARGTFKGKKFQVIGLTQKTDGSGMYGWSEYLLFNPYHGFRWLVCANGHWSFGVPIKASPIVSRGMSVTALYDGTVYKRFLVGKARVVFILGEFYWEARVGDLADVADFIAPPFTLSTERTSDEINWSVLEYIPRDEIEKIFPQVEKTVAPFGVAPNQPNPHANIWPNWAVALIAVAVLMLGEMGIKALQSGKTVLASDFTTTPLAAGASASKVVPYVNLEGRTTNVVIESNAPVNNSWIELDYSLINLEDQSEYGATSEVSYYSGADSDGSWTEGSQRSEVVIPAVPAGKYALKIEESGSPNLALTYSTKIKRDVPYYGNMMLAILLLLVGPFWKYSRRATFESARWADSDLGGGYDDE